MKIKKLLKIIKSGKKAKKVNRKKSKAYKKFKKVQISNAIFHDWLTERIADSVKKAIVKDGK